MHQAREEKLVRGFLHQNEVPVKLMGCRVVQTRSSEPQLVLVDIGSLSHCSVIQHHVGVGRRHGLITPIFGEIPVCYSLLSPRMKNMKTVFPADEQGFFLEPIGSIMGAYNNDGDGDDHGGGAADDDDDDDDDDDVNDEFAVTVGAEAHEIHSS